MPQFNKKEIIALVILAVFAAGGISWYIMQRATMTTDKSDIQGTMRIVRADHYYQNGSHTYKGTLAVPTPCHEVTSQVTVMESHPEQVTIDLKEQGASNFCAQVITQAPFEVNFKASKDARITATLNGEPVLFKVTQKTIDSTATTTTTATSTDTVYVPEGESVN
jgi:hypothetical protein